MLRSAKLNTLCMTNTIYRDRVCVPPACFFVSVNDFRQQVRKGKREFRIYFGVGRCGIAASGIQVRNQIDSNFWGGVQIDSLKGRWRFKHKPTG